MTTRSCFLAILILLLATAASAQVVPDPYFDLDTGTACQGDLFVLTVSVANYSGETSTVVVRRLDSTPDRLGEALLTPEPVDLPLGEVTTLTFTEPGIDAGGTGLYSVDIYWYDGSLYGQYPAAASCAGEPLLMRGFLVDDATFVPCAGQGLSECTQISLFYGSLNQYIGGGRLLEVFGWFDAFDDLQNCAVTITEINSLGFGGNCDDVVPATPLSWGGLKARYR